MWKETANANRIKGSQKNPLTDPNTWQFRVSEQPQFLQKEDQQERCIDKKIPQRDSTRAPGGEGGG